MGVQPVLIKIFNQPISSFGFFLLLAFFASAFFIWRLIRVYELDEETTIDLILLTFAGSLIAARAYYVIFHPDQFTEILRIFMINRYPGLSFWGALLGGFATLRLLSLKFKFNFYQLADFALVGLFIGMAVSSVGCLLGSCQYGQVSDLPVAVTQVGLIGKRFPLQIVEGVLLLIAFWSLWKLSLRFHVTGQIASLGLIFLGMIKFATEFFRGDRQFLYSGISAGMIFSTVLFIYGVWIYYRQNRRSFLYDLKFVFSLPVNSNRRQRVVNKFVKSWYNLRINLGVYFSRSFKDMKKRLNVKKAPPEGF